MFRAPYYPVDSPIEHVFNAVQVDLMLAMYRLELPQHVRDEFYRCLRKMRTFVPFFEHVGIMN